MRSYRRWPLWRPSPALSSSRSTGEADRPRPARGHVAGAGSTSLGSDDGGNFSAARPSTCHQNGPAQPVTNHRAACPGLGDLGGHRRARGRSRASSCVRASRYQLMDGVPPRRRRHWRGRSGARRRHREARMDVAGSRRRDLRRAARGVRAGLRGNRERHGVRALCRQRRGDLVGPSRQPRARGQPALRQPARRSSTGRGARSS